MDKLNWYEAEDFKYDKFQAYWDFEHNFDLKNWKNACEMSFKTAWNFQENKIKDLEAKNKQLEEDNRELKLKLNKADFIWQKMQKDCQEAISTTWRFIGAYKKENAVPIRGALKIAEYHLSEADWIFDEELSENKDLIKELTRDK